MQSPHVQIDAAIGGNVKVPSILDPVSYTESRKDEVCQMLRNMTNTTHQRKLMHQSLPTHMRRRAMSYEVRRLPRRFRTVHAAQFSKSGVSEKKKRPSRKYRRKPNNLLKEYERRKRAFVWLETHVWHAKRFHMTSRWGYKIPLTPCNKSYRSSYRATSKHCLLYDLSYEGCVEVCGEEGLLKEGFRRLCSERVGLTMAAKAYTGGQRAGYAWLYEDGAYPYNCLGKVRFVWRPSVQEDGEERRTVWMFAHPTFYRQLVEQLVKVFELKNALRKTNDTIEDITRNPADIRCPRYRSKSSGVELVELKDTLNRFHLTGPLSHATIVNTFRLFNPPTHVTQPSNRTWFNDFMENTPKYKKILTQQSTYWTDVKDLTSPGELSPGEVIALLVQDPRLNRPNRRTKALPDAPAPRYNFTHGIPPEVVQQPRAIRNFSPVWDETIRKRISEQMKTTHELNQLRSSETLVPGELCVAETHLQPLPILLLQTPGSQDADYKRLGYGSGWDIILPAGYGLAVWHSFVMWGAKAVGQQEQDMIALESGCDRSGVPDSQLGRYEAVRKHKDAWSRYFKKPNNKRVNYTKLAIASPFRCPWTQLVREWTPEGTERPYFVLRDQEALAKLKLALDRKFNIHSIGLPPDALVPVLLTLKTRGNPGDNAIICLPNRTDFRTNKQNRLASIYSPVYVEPLRKDPHGTERHVLRAQHLRTLKRLRNRRIREKKRLQRANPGTLVRIPKANNRALVEEQLKRMAELWLPATPATVRNQCSRECFGYVTQGGFSLSEGTVNGIGYVTAKGLVKLFKICTKGTVKVLVRGTRTRGYRFATIRVAC
ncbi:ribonucleases P/MRP protein subunit POP1 [Anopheles maculipalpis]|uniref:ribonucleases P/MRP protein subunit POP1 n=1 Tax=Anopheles maculipalpis TaxID=1496333 RepID=UPI0021593D4D|nr:ribonucleases P/MRP protein subunit POP1 [Anopheles maculipalpis]